MRQASVRRNLDGRLEVFTPYMDGNRAFLNNLAPRPDLIHRGGGHWEIRRSLFSKVIRALAERFGIVHLFTEHRTTEKCTASCASAKRDECTCSCNYRNHKGGMAGWLLIDEVLIREEVNYVHHIFRR